MALSQDKPSVREYIIGQSVPLISTGLPCPEACRYHLESDLPSNKVYLLVSRSLATNTKICDRFQQALGDKIVRLRVGMKPHTLWSEVIEIVNDARALSIEVIITVGAGTLTDAAKVIAWALANDVDSEEGLTRLAGEHSQQNPGLNPPTVKHIAVPTSLAGGEYSSYAGATNDRTKVKTVFRPPLQNPAIVVLDPELGATTPSRLFLGTGIRAIDHCVETLCSLQSNAEGDRTGREGLRLLVPSLLAYKKDPGNPDAIMQAFLGAAESMKTSNSGVKKGGSHAIGHQLGPLGVPHGETSCVMLPAVCKWNAMKEANVERQQEVARQLLQMREVQAMVKMESPDLGDILDALIRALELPRTLQSVGIGREMFDKLAENTLTDIWAKTNPVPLTRKEDVLEILEMVAE